MPRVLTVAALALLLFASACQRGPGPVGDRDRSKEQVEIEARELELERLEQVVADYQEHIRSREGELRGLEQDIRAQAGDVIDAVLGRGPNDGVRAEIEQLRESLRSMGVELRSLHEKLAVYSSELARRG